MTSNMIYDAVYLSFGAKHLPKLLPPKDMYGRFGQMIRINKKVEKWPHCDKTMVHIGLIASKECKTTITFKNIHIFSTTVDSLGIYVWGGAPL